MAAGLGAASNIYSYRWGDATRLAIVTNVRISVGSIAAFTPGIVTLALKVGRSFSVAHTGGTAGTLTTNNSKLRTSMGTMLLSDVRIASTAALAGGTVTLDTDAASAITTSVTASAGIGIVAPGTEIWNIEGHSEHPLVFAQNEGFTLQGTVPATGTWTFSVSTKWYEVASY
jgi:hypothetical protein